METAIIKRIEIIMNNENLTAPKFASVIGFSYPTLNNYITGRRKAIDVELICKTIETFPQISAEWLLLGVGEMYKNKEESKKDMTGELLMKTVLELSGENAILKEKVRTLEENKSTFGIAAESCVKYTK